MSVHSRTMSTSFEKYIHCQSTDKTPDVFSDIPLIVGTPDPIRSSTLTHFKGQNIIPLEATFDVLSVELLLVPFVGFLALGLQVLNALGSRNLK